MDIEIRLLQFASQFDAPSAFLFLGPLVLAIALHVIKTASSRQKLHASGPWAGLKVEKNYNTTATLLSLIFIVALTFFTLHSNGALANGAQKYSNSGLKGLVTSNN